MGYGDLHLWVTCDVKSLSSVSCLVVYVKWMLSSVPCEKHVHHTTAARRNGMHWHICKDSRSTTISCSVELELTPLIHRHFSCARLLLLLEVDLDCSIIYPVLMPPTPSCQWLFNIKHVKKVGVWGHLPCRRWSSRTALLVQAWNLSNPAPCSESMLREEHDKEDKCGNILLLICIFPQQSVIWRLSEQDEVVPAFVLNSSWWTYRSWISLILSGTHL